MKKTLSIIMCLCCGIMLSACGAEEIDVFDAVSLSVPTDEQYELTWFKMDNGKTGYLQTEISGFGEVGLQVDISKIEYDKSNADITDFLQSVDFTLSDGEVERGDGTLRNGDTVSVSVSYSKSRAEELGIKIPKTECKIPVSFQEIMRDKSEITKEDWDEIYSHLKAYTQKWGYKADFITDVYYAYYLDNAGDTYLAIVVVEASYDGTEYSMSEFLIDPDTNELVSSNGKYSRLGSQPDAETVKSKLGNTGRQLISLELAEDLELDLPESEWDIAVSIRNIVRDKSEIIKEDLLVDELYYTLKAYVQESGSVYDFITDIYYASYPDKEGKPYLAIVVVEDNCSDGQAKFAISEFLIDPDTNELVSCDEYSVLSSYPDAETVERTLETNGKELISLEFVEHSNDPSRIN